MACCLLGARISPLREKAALAIVTTHDVLGNLRRRVTGPCRTIPRSCMPTHQLARLCRRWAEG